MSESLICHGDYTIQGGVRGLEELVQNNPEMTAVFVTNYEMTMGAMIGVNELGIRIPEQLSMIGFDNLQFARACNPKLTIVAQPTDGIAKEVAKDYAGIIWKIPARQYRKSFLREKLADRDHCRKIRKGFSMIRSDKV